MMGKLIKSSYSNPHYSTLSSIYGGFNISSRLFANNWEVYLNPPRIFFLGKVFWYILYLLNTTNKQNQNNDKTTFKPDSEKDLK